EDEPACHFLHGAPVAERVEARATLHARRLRDAGVIPTLALLSVGEDPASVVYLRRKRAAAERAGMAGLARHSKEGESPALVLRALQDLGRDPEVHGVLLQLPLPEGWSTNDFLLALPPEKDVDGFHPLNAGRLALGLHGFAPCTPLGIRELLRYYR